ncbi:hypothetical protein Kalk_20890 [Ketobacter alkanivorans]|uniref:Uncharacterized protein n=1 Tax=Ketobacter alkanivorans TaxID=1917421 RepID=A0A2K9LR13_9GAMM|nr:hypothetical protein Kalk_20890 [Ketobacter alkanivorans]
MENDLLIKVIKWILDFGMALCIASIFYGLIAKKMFVLGTWHRRSSEPSQYWQCIIGLSLVAMVVGYLRVRFF